MATERNPNEEKTIVDLLNTQVGLLNQILTKSSAITKDTEKQVKAKKELTKEQKAEKKHKDYIAQKEKDTEAFMATFAKSYRRIPNDVKKQLDGEQAITDSMGKRVGKQNAYTALKALQGQQEAIEKNNSGAIAENAGLRADMARQYSDELLIQAKATQRAEDSLKGVTEFDEKRKQIEEARLQLGNTAADLLLQTVNETETLYKKEKRILEIKKQQQGVLDALPGPLKSMIDGAQEFGQAMKAGLGPIALIGALLVMAIKSFTELDDAAADFRKETGLLNSQMEGIKSQALQISTEFANIGLESADVLKTISSLKSEFSDSVDFSKETVAALSVMNKNFGVAAETSAKVQSMFEGIGGLSSETAANVQMQAAQMAKLAGVAPDKVFKDIAENAEAASTFFKGDITALTKNAVQARRMGTSLKEQVSLAEKLLDFEAGIEDELVAATFVGGQFNLGRARALAMEGKLQEANEETLKQIQRSGDFKNKDYFTQKQLAKAAGMTVEEINKQLNTQEKLNSLTAEQKKAAEDAISKGLDITNIGADQLANETAKFASQQEQQKQIDKLMNSFNAIAATVGGTLTPLLEGLIPIMSLIALPVQAMAEGFRVVVNFLKENIGLTIALAGILGVVYAKSIAGAVARIWGSIVGALGPFGIPVAIAATIGAISMAKSAMSVGDMNSPADGKTQVSTKEGGLFELSPNDDLVAAPGAAAALNGKGSVGAQPVATTQLNLSALSAPLNAMIAEIKALRADMASGKIAVHMDGAKVTAGISNQVDKSTRNNFALS
jgi:hypothetical protein